MVDPAPMENKSFTELLGLSDDSKPEDIINTFCERMLRPPTPPDISSYRSNIKFKYKSKFTGPSVGEGATGSGKKPPTLFQGAEHEKIAEELILYDCKGKKTKSGADVLFQVLYKKGEEAEDDDIVDLSFGRIIALAGDHFTNISDENRSPICGAFFKNETSKEERFESMVNNVKLDYDGYLRELNDLINKECDSVRKISEDPDQSVAEAYHKHDCGIPSNWSFYQASLNPTKFGILLSGYAWNSYINADHFGEDAVTTYAVGHGIALKLARKAASQPEERARWQGLLDAYMYDAFAAHYLTDLFSSGHIRVPRRQLHCMRPNVLARTLLPVTWRGIKLDKLKDLMALDPKLVPIWDNQALYMHDNDSVTGLLVCNKKGEQWIAYGDSQYLESANAVNRARAQLALQASVDELFYKGYQGKDPLPTPDDYSALQLTPLPSHAIDTSVAYEKGVSYDTLHNPAPLWMALTHKEPEADMDKWSRRADVNDHSNFARIKANPGNNSGYFPWPTASKEAQEVQDARFLCDKSIVGRRIENLVGGGFLQVQDLKRPDSNTELISCINVWGPAKVRLDGKMKVTFTLRNRISDVPRLSQTEILTPLHWTKWFDGTTTSLARFDWKKGAGEIIVSCFKFQDAKDQLVTFEAGKSWAIKLSTTSNQIREAVVQPGEKGNSSLSQGSLLRFIVARLTPESSLENPDIAVIKVDFIQRFIRVAICRTIEGMSKALDPIVEKWDSLPSHLTFVKPFTQSPNLTHRGIAIISFMIEQNTTGTLLQIDLVSVTNSTESSLIKAPFSVPYTSGVAGASVLVGDVLGDGVDKIIVLHTPPQTVNNPILIYKLETNPQPGLSLYGTHHCRSKSDLTSMTLVRPYITALLPATNTVGQTEEQTQINVVSISLYRNSDGKHILVFSTHCYIGGERHESTDPWNECHNSQQEDPLYDIGDAYRHIKWLRCSVDKSPNGLMEIFSLYGVLGVRVFAPTNNKEGVGLYEWVGQTPYLGQTAIGAGRGSHVDWGHGFQTWGNNEDFIDVNTWIPEVGTEERQGPGTLGAWDKVYLVNVHVWILMGLQARTELRKK